MSGWIRDYKLKNGETRWAYGYRWQDPVTGRTRSTTKRGFTRKRDAETALRKVLIGIDEGTHVEPSKITVAEWADEFLESIEPTGKGGRRHRGKVGIGTHATYRQYLETYVVRRWGQRRLADITARDIDKLYDHLEREGGRSGTGLSPKTVANLHGVLSQFFKAAVRRDPPVLARNPLERVAAPKPNDPDTAIWDAAELGRFVEHVTLNDPDRLAGWLLFVTTGLRRGEVSGLVWPDIDLEAGTVTVRMTLGLVDSKITWKAGAKTEAGDRTIALDPATVAALRDHRARQLRWRLAAGEVWEDGYTDWRGTRRDDRVFTREDGAIINPARWSAWFRKHCADAGLQRIRAHDMRHSYATLAASRAESFADVIVLSRRLGHKSVAVTLDRYGHYLPRQDEAMAKGLAELILGA
ncbi:MAG: tyrosine-type recombinase/integrase [Nitriliruptorales bacterium]